MVAYWKLDEGTGGTAYDSIGSNDGTLINDPNWTTGQVDDALDFDGVDDYIQVSSSSGLEIDSNKITIAAWVKPDTFTSPISQTVARKMLQTGDSGGYLLRLRRNAQDKPYLDMGLKLVGADYVSINDSDIEMRFNQWAHVAGVYDGDYMRLYLNGEEILALSQSGNIISSSTPFVIGRLAYDSGSEYFHGSIDEVAIWDRALDADEVAQLYENGLEGHGYVSPLFADADNGDYHLLSERGRYLPAMDKWIMDKTTSPGVDGGDPGDDPRSEAMPNGGRINMGAYGGTAYGSMSEWPVAGDVNQDGIVNIVDFAIVAGDWMDTLEWVE